VLLRITVSVETHSVNSTEKKQRHPRTFRFKSQANSQLSNVLFLDYDQDYGKISAIKSFKIARLVSKGLYAQVFLASYTD
jgi:hypothetical protein